MAGSNWESWIRWFVGLFIKKKPRYKRIPLTPVYHVLVLAGLVNKTLAVYGKAKTIDIFRMLKRMENVFGDLKRDPQLFNELDITWHESFHGKCAVVRDQRGPLSPLGSAQVQLFVFEDPENSTLVLCGVETRWTRYVREEQLELFGQFFSAYKDKEIGLDPLFRVMDASS